MACSLEFDSKHKMLRLTIDGRLTDDMLFEGYKLAAAYAATCPPSCSITDLAKVTSNEVSSNAVMELAKSLRPDPVPVRRVIVVPQMHSYGVARMFQILSEEVRPDLHIVRAMDEAYRLLGVESPEFVPVNAESHIPGKDA
jgi:hypothetical protein